jgi:hypothetical protein
VALILVYWRYAALVLMLVLVLRLRLLILESLRERSPIYSLLLLLLLLLLRGHNHWWCRSGVGGGGCTHTRASPPLFPPHIRGIKDHRRRQEPHIIYDPGAQEYNHLQTPKILHFNPSEITLINHQLPAARLIPYPRIHRQCNIRLIAPGH